MTAGGVAVCWGREGASERQLREAATAYLAAIEKRRAASIGLPDFYRRLRGLFPASRYHSQTNTHFLKSLFLSLYRFASTETEGLNRA